MKKEIVLGICIVLLLFCMFTGVTSAKPAVAWEKNLGAPLEDISCHVKSIKQTPDGNYILVGSCWCPSGSGVHGEGGGWTKLDSSGEFCGVLGGEGWGWIRDMKLSAVYKIGNDTILVGNEGGNVVISSSFHKGVHVEDKYWKKTFKYVGLNIFPISIVTSDNQVILIYPYRCSIRLTKIDTEGHIRWDKNIKRAKRGVYANTIISASDGGYILAGGINTGKTLGPGKEKEAGDVDLYDTYLIKIDPEGDVEWEKSINVGHSDKAHSIKQAHDGFFISGEFGAGWSDPKKGPFLMKTDLKGNKKWVKEGIGGKIVETTSDCGCVIIDGSLYKIDRNGNVVWKVESVGYDAVRTSDGGFFAVDTKFRSARSEYYPHDTIYYNEILLRKLEEPIIEIIDISETENSLEQEILGKVFN